MAINKNTHNCIDCGFKHNAFSKLTKEELAKVNKNRLEVTYNEGETIYNKVHR